MPDAKEGAPEGAAIDALYLEDQRFPPPEDFKASTTPAED
jgi:hypothetical protein